MGRKENPTHSKSGTANMLVLSSTWQYGMSSNLVSEKGRLGALSLSNSFGERWVRRRIAKVSAEGFEAPQTRT